MLGVSLDEASIANTWEMVFECLPRKVCMRLRCQLMDVRVWGGAKYGTLALRRVGG